VEEVPEQDLKVGVVPVDLELLFQVEQKLH
jgi:hypothetical protein